MAFLKEYTSLGSLGSGGFAEVFKVRHNQLGYVRAIRVLNQIVESEDSQLYNKFIKECKVLLRLGNGNHPNIVHIYKPYLRDQKAFVEMDYIDGCNVYEYLEKSNGFVETDEVMQFAKEISSALSYCHHDIYEYCMDADSDHLEFDPEDGSRYLIDKMKELELVNKYKVIHNDMHSGNIMRRKNGGYILLDFGLSIEGDSVAVSSKRANGAPEYKAPEKWDKDLITEQSDIYGFGCILYMMLAGNPPFPAPIDYSNSFTAQKEMYESHKSKTPPSIFPLRKAAFEKKHNKSYKKDYPDWLEGMIFKCLSKRPEDRFQNGHQFYQEFIRNYIEYGKSVTQGQAAHDAQFYEMQIRINKLSKSLDNSKQEIRSLLQALRALKNKK